MKHVIRKIAFLAFHFTLFTCAVGTLNSCSRGSSEYVIGVSQCSDDSWRTKLKAELEMATYFNEGVELRMATANDDNKLQEKQIDSLANSGIDLLIVSPNQVNSVSAAINRTLEKKIPVILYDRKTDSQNFTAFMGADNILIGEMLAEYVAGQLNGRGNIVEIMGLKGSSPAVERHEGFMNAIKRYPDIHVIASDAGDWKEKSGAEAMKRILQKMEDSPEGMQKIDCIYGANDRMAVGARQTMEAYCSAHPDQKLYSTDNIIYLGVDALPNKDKGIGQVNDGILTASAIYPTQGPELIELALKILHGEEYDKVNMMQSSIVTSANARVLLQQHEEVVKRGEYLKKMHQRVDTILTELGTERLLLVVILVVTIVICVLLVLMVRAYRAKHELNEQLHLRNEELSKEKEIAERQRDELEEQRDKLIEATMHTNTQEPAPSQTDNSLDPTPSEQAYKQETEFMKRFYKCVEEHLSDSDLSVEDLGSDMCLSRVQLYRKVKALTGKSPVEIIRETRLIRASQLLKDSSLTISEIAYRVGFSSPSYFTKCYRDLFGKSPTEVQGKG